MTPLTFIALNLAIIVFASVVTRFWLRGQSQPLLANYRLCGVIMWLGCLVIIAALAISLTGSNPTASWLLVSTGLSIMTSMFLQRKGLARRMEAGHKHSHS